MDLNGLLLCVWVCVSVCVCVCVCAPAWKEKQVGAKQQLEKRNGNRYFSSRVTGREEERREKKECDSLLLILWVHSTNNTCVFTCYLLEYFCIWSDCMFSTVAATTHCWSGVIICWSTLILFLCVSLSVFFIVNPTVKSCLHRMHSAATDTSQGRVYAPSKNWN